MAKVVSLGTKLSEVEFCLCCYLCNSEQVIQSSLHLGLLIYKLGITVIIIINSNNNNNSIIIVIIINNNNNSTYGKSVL